MERTKRDLKADLDLFNKATPGACLRKGRIRLVNHWRWR